jgi:hypothetical protein
MPLATKNNAIIVKDGKLAENCECCDTGGWYCNALQYSVTASVSGLGETVFDFCNPSTVINTTFSAGNKTYSLIDGGCGTVRKQEQVQQSYELPTLFGGVWHYGTFFILNAWFTTSLASGASTAPGYVVFQVSAIAQVRYIESFTFIDWDIDGTYESAPLTIDSLPASGSWLSGRSAVISMAGTYGTMRGVRCTIAPQDVTISFS